MRVIGLAGYPGVGKDEVAKILANFIEDTAVISFADPLRKIVGVLEGIAPQALKLQEVKARPSRLNPSLSRRQVLELIGTEGGRELISDSIWVDLMGFKLTALESQNYDLVVIPDVRFINEIAMVKAFDGEVIWIDRPGCVSTGHKSSQDISGFCDNTFSNNSTINDLADTVRDLFL